MCPGGLRAVRGGDAIRNILYGLAAEPVRMGSVFEGKPGKTLKGRASLTLTRFKPGATNRGNVPFGGESQTAARKT